ncbi:hypothetical protein R6Q59_032456 [Mikania micrantha]
MAFHNSGHIHLLFITIILLTSVTSGDDAAVMRKLSTTLSPTPTSWTSTAYCKWDGITCENSNRVTAINLPSKSLTGTLPLDINQLSQLKTLAVQCNFISRALPTLATSHFWSKATISHQFHRISSLVFLIIGQYSIKAYAF